MGWRRGARRNGLRRSYGLGVELLNMAELTAASTALTSVRPIPYGLAPEDFMEHIFNPSSYPIRAMSGKCFACGGDGRHVTTEDRAAFARMTARSWPGTPLLGYRLSRDLEELGIVHENAPEMAYFCICCSAKYMAMHNERLAQKKVADSHDTEETP